MHMCVPVCMTEGETHLYLWRPQEHHSSPPQPDKESWSATSWWCPHWFAW